jgi:hypothetical protein
MAGEGIAGNVARVAAGAFGPLLSSLFTKRIHRWELSNLDTKEKVKGQFGPSDLKEQPGVSVYAEHTSLNRGEPILQYVHGSGDQLTFNAYFFATDDKDETPAKILKVLKNWSKRDPKLLRPPLVAFTLGDGEVSMRSAVMSLGDVQYYDPPKERAGGIRGWNSTITLRAYTKFELKSEPLPQTRYHRAKQGDYFEYLAYFEYGNPMLGDLVRKQHPDKLLLSEGEVVTLHSVESLRTTAVKPRSLIFQGVTSTKTSDQKTLRQDVVDRNSLSYSSSIVRYG